MTLTRREWLQRVGSSIALSAALPMPMLGQAPAASRGAVTLGVQSYSFRDRPIDAAIAAMQQLGLTTCELWQRARRASRRGTRRDAPLA